MENQQPIVLEAKTVYKSFKDVKAVNGISLQIKKGEYVALLGPNGAGKTTFIEMIEGIQQPDNGEIRINGMLWKHHKIELNRILGISFQETRFIDKLKVQETLELFASFYGLKHSRISEILEMIQLTEKRKAYVVNLSGGQRQRLALGIALLNQPEILLLDEPSTGLDPTSRREIWNILMKLKKEKNTTMILTTHYMEEAEYLCDRIVIMDKGTILVEATLEKLLSDYTTGQVIDFSTDIQKFNTEMLSGYMELKPLQEAGRFRLIVKDSNKYLPYFFETLNKNEVEIRNFECRRRTLDDLSISLTGRHLEE